MCFFLFADSPKTKRSHTSRLDVGAAAHLADSAGAGALGAGLRNLAHLGGVAGARAVCARVVAAVAHVGTWRACHGITSSGESKQTGRKSRYYFYGTLRVSL